MSPVPNIPNCMTILTWSWRSGGAALRGMQAARHRRRMHVRCTPGGRAQIVYRTSTSRWERLCRRRCGATTSTADGQGKSMITRRQYLYFATRALDGMAGIVAELGDDLANRKPPFPGANSPY